MTNVKIGHFDSSKFSSGTRWRKQTIQIVVAVKGTILQQSFLFIYLHWADIAFPLGVPGFEGNLLVPLEDVK